MNNMRERSAPYDSRPIKAHGPSDFAGMRVAGRLAAETLDFITPHVQPGVRTEDLDRLCADFIRGHGAIAAPLNYRGFPKSICTSINHVVCHGIPGEKKLRAGDILNIDVTVIVDGWHGDTSRMFSVGSIPVKAQRLIDVTYEAMWRGIEAVRPGATVGDIGHPIQALFEAHRLSVGPAFFGPGPGRRPPVGAAPPPPGRRWAVVRPVPRRCPRRSASPARRSPSPSPRASAS